MKTQSILEGNKLIDKFNDNQLTKLGVSELNYHQNWNLLMPVVEKIEAIEQDGLYYNFQILGGCSVYIISSDMEEIISVDNGGSKLHNVWLTVIEFIKWYNNKK